MKKNFVVFYYKLGIFLIDCKTLYKDVRQIKIKPYSELFADVW